MSSRFFILLFFHFTFSLGFSQNTVKNGTFKGYTKKTKLFKKSDSKLLNKKGEFTIQSRYNRRVKQSGRMRDAVQNKGLKINPKKKIK